MCMEKKNCGLWLMLNIFFSFFRFYDVNFSNCMVVNIMRVYKMVKRYWLDRKVEWIDR